MVEVLTVLLASNIFVLSVGVVVRVNEPHCLFMVLLPLKIIFSSREHLKQKFNVKIIFQAGQIWKNPNIFIHKNSFSSYFSERKMVLIIDFLYIIRKFKFLQYCSFVSHPENMKSQLPNFHCSFIQIGNCQKNESMIQIYARDDCRNVMRISIPHVQ